MWDVDANVFVIRLIRQVLERRFVQWTPGRDLYFIPLPYQRTDGYVEKHIIKFSIAIEKLSFIENSWDAEEFEYLYPILGAYQGNFLDFFINCVPSCYLKCYSSFNFIRYLRYVLDFAIFCNRKGFPEAFDFAAITIAHIMHKYAYIFVDFENWKKLINEVHRIARYDFCHPYIIKELYSSKGGNYRGTKKENLNRN